VKRHPLDEAGEDFRAAVGGRFQAWSVISVSRRGDHRQSGRAAIPYS
jgi:hypothetical protein